VAEALRKQFNAAGGDIGKLINWALPQHHSQLQVAKAGRDAWIADILPKLDRGQYMKDDGSRFTDAEMQKFLGDVWETIATGGVNKIEPGQVRGAGMRANRNADPRALHFRDADGYLDYQTKYGERDLYGVMVAHVGRLAKDVAMLRDLRPESGSRLCVFPRSGGDRGREGEPAQRGQAQGALDQARQPLRLRGRAHAARGERVHRARLRHAAELARGDAARVGLRHVVLGRGDALSHGPHQQPARDAGVQERARGDEPGEQGRRSASRSARASPSRR
jgi:hypothetical protein